MSVSNPKGTTAWSKIARINHGFLVTYLILLFTIDLLVVVGSGWDLAPYWYTMLAIFGVWMLLYFFENSFLKEKLQDNKPKIDVPIAVIIVLRNIVVLLNFIPLIQLLGLALLASAFQPSLNLFGQGSLGSGGGFAAASLIGPVLVVAYVLLVSLRLFQAKKF